MKMESYGLATALVIGRVTVIQQPLFQEDSHFFTLEVAHKIAAVQAEVIPIKVLTTAKKNLDNCGISAGDWVKVEASLTMRGNSGSLALLTDVFSITNYGADPTPEVQEEALLIEFE